MIVRIDQSPGDQIKQSAYDTLCYSGLSEPSQAMTGSDPVAGRGGYPWPSNHCLGISRVAVYPQRILIYVPCVSSPYPDPSIYIYTLKPILSVVLPSFITYLSFFLNDNRIVISQYKTTFCAIFRIRIECFFITYFKKYLYI